MAFSGGTASSSSKETKASPGRKFTRYEQHEIRLFTNSYRHQLSPTKN
jgi:hypothetical protein